MRYAMLVLMAGFASISPLAAQGPLPVTPGQRVRLSLDGGHGRVAGVLVSQDGDSVAILSSADVPAIAIPQNSVAAVEVSAGRHSNAGVGAAIGLLGGAVVGGMLGASCA